MKVITTHFNADFDCLASMLSAKKLYPDARIVFPGAQEKNVRDFLKASDYSFQFDKLKNISLNEITTLIIVDTRLAGRIGPFGEVANKKGVSVHVYDHHPNTPQDIESDVTVVKERGSTTTIFVELLREKGIPLTPAEATIMALGIYEDTGSLTFTSTRPEDLEASAYLLSIGANLNTVSDFIYRELSPEQFSLLNDLIHGLEIHDINGLPVAVATASSDHYIGDLAILTHKLKDMENLNCLFVLVRMEDRIHLVARSRIEAVDVAAVAHEFGGGGHPTASSATIRDMTLIQVEERLINVLKEKVHPVKLAKEMMTYPVKSVQRDEAIKSAEELMTRYNISALPVLDGKKTVGLITRQIVEKAIFHHLKEEKVSDLMISEFSTVHSDTPYRRIDEIIIVGKQRLVPVVNDSGEMEGIISRGDLLRAIYGDMLKKPAVLYSKEGGTRYPFSKNLRGLLSERLPERILKLLDEAGDVANEMGFSAFLVGGFVRDLLLRLVPESFNQGIENLDIDIVIEGDGILFAEKFAERLSGRIKSHKKFGTAVVIIPSLPPSSELLPPQVGEEKGGGVLKGGFKIDIATARMEYYEHPAALPIVEMSSLKNDLYRRDFTINTLAISLNKKGAWNLIDFFGGQRDLKERAIRVLHNLSFVEDPTRVFRAIRFEQRFNFSIGKQTMTLLEGAVKKDLFNRLSGSRVYLELVLMLKEREPLKMVKRMQELSLLKFIHPKIIYSDSMKELFLNIGETISWHHLLFIGSEAEGWFIYLMGLLDYLKDEDVLDAFRRLSISEHYKNKLLTSRTQIKEAYQELFSSGTNTFKSSLIYDVLHPLPLEALLFMMAKVPQERIKKAISLYLTKLRTVKIDITGDDIVGMGIERGPQIGSILKAIRDAKLDGLIKDKKDEIEFVKKKLQDSQKPHNIPA